MDKLLILGLVLLVIAMFLSRGGKPSQRYDITRSQDTRLAKVQREETAMQTRARAGAAEEAANARNRRGLLMSGRYPGLTAPAEIETVYGEVVEDPRLPSGAPQLSPGGRPQLQSGEDYAIAKKRQMRGW